MVWTIVFAVLFALSLIVNFELWSLAKSMKEELLVERDCYNKLVATYGNYGVHMSDGSDNG